MGEEGERGFEDVEEEEMKVRKGKGGDGELGRGEVDERLTGWGEGVGEECTVDELFMMCDVCIEGVNQCLFLYLCIGQDHLSRQDLQQLGSCYPFLSNHSTLCLFSTTKSLSNVCLQERRTISQRRGFEGCIP